MDQRDVRLTSVFYGFPLSASLVPCLGEAQTCMLKGKRHQGSLRLHSLHTPLSNHTHNSSQDKLVMKYFLENKSATFTHFKIKHLNDKERYCVPLEKHSLYFCTEGK